MKRMVTMKRMVRLAVGSLCLLALMVNVAPAATDPDPPYYCVWAPYRDDGPSGNGWTSLVSLTNPDVKPRQYKVTVITKDNPPGFSTTVSLAAAETRFMPCTDLKGCGRLGHLRIDSTDGSFFIGSLLVSDAVGLTTIELAACFLASPPQ